MKHTFDPALPSSEYSAIFIEKIRQMGVSEATGAYMRQMLGIPPLPAFDDIDGSFCLWPKEGAPTVIIIGKVEETTLIGRSRTGVDLT